MATCGAARCLGRVPVGPATAADPAAPGAGSSATSASSSGGTRVQEILHQGCADPQILLRDQVIGGRVVPIVPDEARTFGMEVIFREFGIYRRPASCTARSTPPCMYYREATNGQMLQEGITEAGAIASLDRRRPPRTAPRHAR